MSTRKHTPKTWNGPAPSERQRHVRCVWNTNVSHQWLALQVMVQLMRPNRFHLKDRNLSDVYEIQTLALGNCPYKGWFSWQDPAGLNWRYRMVQPHLKVECVQKANASHSLQLIGNVQKALDCQIWNMIVTHWTSLASKTFLRNRSNARCTASLSQCKSTNYDEPVLMERAFSSTLFSLILANALSLQRGRRADE